MGDEPNPHDEEPDEETVNCARADAIEMAHTGAITQRRAFAYSLRDIHNIGRQKAATVMETTPTNVDTLLQNARRDIDSSQEIVEYLNEHTGKTEDNDD